MAQDAYKDKENYSADSCVPTALCYNGDIVDEESFGRIVGELYPEYSCGDYLHVMIGRGLLMDPNIPNNLRVYENSSASIDSPEITKRSFDKKLFKEFLNEITEDYKQEMSNEKQVVMKMKELWVYFAKGLGLSDRQLKEVLKTSRLADYKAVVQMVLSDV